MTSSVVEDTPQISVVIPTCNSSLEMMGLIESLDRQILPPAEVIIVDSSDGDGTQKIVENNHLNGILRYKRIDKAYPGKARNIGVQMATYDWIAFLDSKTVPQDNWLSEYINLAKANAVDVVFGLSRARSKGTYQSLLRAASYGLVSHPTIPGSLVKKQTFLESGGFLEDVRAGEDLEWKDRLKQSKTKTYCPETSLISYYGIPMTVGETVRKYVSSSYHNARATILSNRRDAYLSVLLVFITLLVAKWNHIIGGWKMNPLYISHVTKLYLLSMSFFFIVYTIIRLIFHVVGLGKILTLTLKFTIFILFSGLILKWNAVFAGWVEDAIWYIPHITKIYVCTLALSSILFRGLLLPRKRGVGKDYLYPFRWIVVGLLGLILDVAKAPGFIFGALLGLLQNVHFMIKKQFYSAD